MRVEPPIEACLWVNPFEGDRDGGARLLSDRLVVPRVTHHCHVCLGRVAPGQQARARREAFEGRAATFYFCALCCLAQARSFTDSGRSLTRRYVVGERRADRIRSDKKRRAS